MIQQAIFKGLLLIMNNGVLHKHICLFKEQFFSQFEVGGAQLEIGCHIFPYPIKVKHSLNQNMMTVVALFAFIVYKINQTIPTYS